mmetsp:Transcript_12402/g.21193  ORF Transcript_12402/g.21193 Transcript_12402/m.21193 type:complete len:581 (+) Transcript_12402:90-1832(+)
MKRLFRRPLASPNDRPRLARFEPWIEKLKQFIRVNFGFIADAYDLFVINLVIQTLHFLYGASWKTYYSSMLGSAAIIGMITGQLTGGALADMFGRKPAFVVAAMLTVLGSVLSAVAVAPKPSEDGSIVSLAGFMAQLCCFRFLLGLGIGAEYPLASTVAYEHEHETSPRDEAKSVRSVLGVFCMQGVGFLLCPIVFLILLSTISSYSVIWRLALGLGSIPSFIAFLFRLTMHESQEWIHKQEAIEGHENASVERRESVERTISKAVERNLAEPSQNEPHISTASISLKTKVDEESGVNVLHENGDDDYKNEDAEEEEDEQEESDSDEDDPSMYFNEAKPVVTKPGTHETIPALLWKYRRSLLVSACSWFIFDVTFYGNALIQASIEEASGVGTTLRDDTFNALRVAFLALPGYVLSYLFAYRIGLKLLQVIAFVFLTILYTLLAVLLPYLKKWFIVVYGSSFLFSNLGRSTVFVLAAKLFPSEIRATCHGISSASGKIGALVGSFMFSPIAAHTGAFAVFISCAAFSGAGFFVALLLPSQKCPKVSKEANDASEPLNSETAKELPDLKDLELELTNGAHI